MSSNATLRLALCAALAGWAAGCAPAAREGRTGRMTARQRRTMKQIQTRTVTFCFEKTPLTEAIDVLRTWTGMRFRTKGLDADDPDRNPGVTLTAHEMKLETALEWIARLTGTRWELDDGVVCFDGTRRVEPCSVMQPAAPLTDRQVRRILKTKKASLYASKDELTKVLRNLADEIGVDIEVKLRDDEWDPPLTLRVVDMPAGCALSWVARESYTSWGIRDGVIRFGHPHEISPGVWGVFPDIPPETVDWKTRKKQYDKILDTKHVRFFFEGTELSRVLTFLTDITGLSMVLTHPHGENDPPLTLRIEESEKVTLRQALHRIANHTGMAWDLEDAAVHFHPPRPDPD